VVSSRSGEAVKIFLASFGLAFAQCGQRGRNAVLAWAIAERYGCLVVRLTSSFRTWWPLEQLSQSLRTSVLCASLLVTAQYSEWFRKMGRMQLLYSLVGIEIFDSDYLVYIGFA